jgi:hypothetical protein
LSYRDTYDTLCVLLEEYADSDVETIATQILGALGVLGEDLLEAIDPPVGLSTWLHSHSLSLVATTEARSPRVWDACQEEARREEEEDLEEGENEEPPLQVGDYVQYRTAPKGPSQVQEIGSGWVREMGLEDGAEFLWVDNGGKQVYVVPAEGDYVSAIPR